MYSERRAIAGREGWGLESSDCSEDYSRAGKKGGVEPKEGRGKGQAFFLYCVRQLVFGRKPRIRTQPLPQQGALEG